MQRMRVFRKLLVTLKIASKVQEISSCELFNIHYFVLFFQLIQITTFGWVLQTLKLKENGSG